MASANLFMGLTPEEKGDFKHQLKYNVVLKKVREVLENEIRRLETPSKDVYKDAAWAYRQADENGERRAYKSVLKLLDPEEKNG